MPVIQPITTASGTSSYVPTTRILTINGVSYDLSADRTWTIGASNIYTTDGTLTGNRVLSSGGFTLRFDANLGLGKVPAYPLDVNGTAAATGVLTTSIFNANNPIYIYTQNDPSNAAYGRLRFYYDSLQHRITSEGAGGSTRDLGLMGGGAGGQLYLGTSGSNKWYITGSYNALGEGHLIPTSDTVYNIGDTSFRVWKYYGVKSYLATNLQIGGSLTEYNSSLLTMDSTSKGFLPPRMTSTQRGAITSPQIGLIVYQTDGDEGLWQFTNSGWQFVGGAYSGTVTSVGLTSSTGGVTITNTPITSSGDINIEIDIASATTDGLLMQSDWSAFNGKMNNPMTTLGDTIYGNAVGLPIRRAGNTTTTKMYLSQTGTGTSSAAPQWSAITASDVGGVPTTRTLTINDVAFDLSADRSWSIGDFGTW
jgi:hypothetical protein